jgi:anti-anti-sigma regulatory factor
MYWDGDSPKRLRPVRAVTDNALKLTVTAEVLNEATVLVAHGVLDTSTYLFLRNRIIKAALEEPPAVVVDITDLLVPTESALAVFTSARWHVEQWPEVPVSLVCARPAGRQALSRNGITRYVAAYPTVEEAISAVAQSGYRPPRRRARALLPADDASLHRTRELVSDWLTVWSQPELIAVVKVIATSLIENVLEHTDTAPCLRLETDGDVVTVAVEDSSRTPAGVRERPDAVGRPSGLRIVSTLSRVWGNSPTPTGKTVWAVVGPENRL